MSMSQAASTRTENLRAEMDAFASVPEDLTVRSAFGGVLSLVAVVTSVALVSFQTVSFVTSTDVGGLVQMDNASDQESDMTINFDVTVDTLPCDHLTVGVRDALSSSRINVSGKVLKQPIDVISGAAVGEAKADEQHMDLDLKKVADSHSAWSEKTIDANFPTSEVLKNQDFESVLATHDVTVVMFSRSFCADSADAIPQWKQFEENMKTTDIAASVQMVHINCHEFMDMCLHADVWAFPTVRAYHGASAFSTLKGPVTERSLNDFTQHEAAYRQSDDDLKLVSKQMRGCRVSGRVAVPRASGMLLIEPLQLNGQSNVFGLAIVSHTVHHLSFSSNESVGEVANMFSAEYAKNIAPVDGKSLGVNRHSTSEHQIEVMPMVSEGGVSAYHLNHQHSEVPLDEEDVAEIRFQYELSPVQVTLFQEQFAWYDFMASVVGIVGGVFALFNSVVPLFLGAKRSYRV